MKCKLSVNCETVELHDRTTTQMRLRQYLKEDVIQFFISWSEKFQTIKCHTREEGQSSFQLKNNFSQMINAEKGENSKEQNKQLLMLFVF